MSFRDDITTNAGAEALSVALIDVFQSIYDPEIELDIYNLGMIYEVSVDETGHCRVLMTFTDTNCGCEDTLPHELADKLKTIPEITSTQVEVTWSPAWKITRISRLGRIALGISPR